jgi:hypothetical protein
MTLPPHLNQPTPHVSDDQPVSLFPIDHLSTVAGDSNVRNG